MQACGDDLRDPEAANQRFREEAARYRFHFRCPSCAHYERASRACSMGFPNQFLMGEHLAIAGSGALTFCKYFELGETLDPDP